MQKVSKSLAFTFLLAALLLLTACQLTVKPVHDPVASPGTSPNVPPAPTLLELQEIAQLQNAFNAGHGQPRLILLLSPT